MTDLDLIKLIRETMQDADIAWAEMRSDERGLQRPSDLKAARVLRALRKAGAIAPAAKSEIGRQHHEDGTVVIEFTDGSSEEFPPECRHLLPEAKPCV